MEHWASWRKRSNFIQSHGLLHTLGQSQCLIVELTWNRLWTKCCGRTRAFWIWLAPALLRPRTEDFQGPIVAFPAFFCFRLWGFIATRYCGRIRSSSFRCTPSVLDQTVDCSTCLLRGCQKAQEKNYKVRSLNVFKITSPATMTEHFSQRYTVRGCQTSSSCTAARPSWKNPLHFVMQMTQCQPFACPLFQWESVVFGFHKMLGVCQRKGEAVNEAVHWAWATEFFNAVSTWGY